MVFKFLFKQIDNSALIVFRIIFGILLCIESIGAIFTGWVKRVFIEPEFTFTFIGFEWLQPLPGYGMYVYYVVMGICGLLVALGLFYRYSMAAFTLMWTATYLMQKSSYNNHYYLLILLCCIMLFLPAHKYFSVDAKRKPSIQKFHMPQWVTLVFLLQIFTLYTYAAIAKIYPGWLDLSAIKAFMLGKSHFYIVGEFLQNEGLHYFLTYGGILFDLLIAIALLYQPTRKFAFGCAIFFHLFNSIIFQVGIFPYLGLSFCLFFFEPKVIRNIFLKRKPLYVKDEIEIPPNKTLGLGLAITYFIIQLLLPLRHWAIPGNVLFTEEGHRMSWRMMLRSKQSDIHFRIKDTEHDSEVIVNPRTELSSKQARVIGGRPDMIWQYAQHLKNKALKNGKNISVYAIGRINVNYKGWHEFIDPTVDLAAESWSPFKPHTWIRDIKEE